MRSNVRHVVYAGSGSVYGVKDEPNVTEDLSLVPISTYNKTKMVAERVFLSYSDHFNVHCVRPATVCGLSPRMRLDVAVNMLTYQALTKKEITILEVIKHDLISILMTLQTYIYLINNSDSIKSGRYNAASKIFIHIAKIIQDKISAICFLKNPTIHEAIAKIPQRFFNSFKPKKSVSVAVDEIISAYQSGKLPDVTIASL